MHLLPLLRAGHKYKKMLRKTLPWLAWKHQLTVARWLAVLEGKTQAGLTVEG